MEWHHCQYAENAVEGNMQDDFCDVETDCSPGLCCGMATAIDEDGYEIGKMHVCNDENSFEWVDHLDWETLYSFKCLEIQPAALPQESLAAFKLFASFVAASSALYILV